MAEQATASRGAAPPEGREGTRWDDQRVERDWVAEFERAQTGSLSAMNSFDQSIRGRLASKPTDAAAGGQQHPRRCQPQPAP
jgi:hypothetical protein